MKAVKVDITPASMGMRLPYSYQSRPFFIPSPNTFYGALLRAAYLLRGRPGYEAVAASVSYTAFSIVGEISVVSMLTTRVKMDYEGIAKGKKPTNVFPDTYAVPSSYPVFRAIYLLREGAQETEVLRAAASITLLGDSDSPANASGATICEVADEGAGEAETRYSFLLDTAALVGGEAIIAEAPVTGYASKYPIMRRVYRRVATPAKRVADTIFPAAARASVIDGKGMIARARCGGANELLIIPGKEYLSRLWGART